MHGMEVYVEVEVLLHSFLALVYAVSGQLHAGETARSSRSVGGFLTLNRLWTLCRRGKCVTPSGN
jgi:hypothetical protein